MQISRRAVLKSFGAAVIIGPAAQPLRVLASANEHQPVRCENSSPCTIFLDRNENAYGPSEKVLAVLRDASHSANRYPRTEYDSLIGTITRTHKLKPDHLGLACGSSEILRVAAAEFLKSGMTLLQAAPTCPQLATFARQVGAGIVNVPLTKTYEHDLNGMLARVNDSTGLVYICNPNDPTGTLTRRADIDNFVRKLPPQTMVLIDEAYHEFVGPNPSYVSFLEKPLDDPRVIVTRTFSKIYGLAGMRVGYMVATPETVGRISSGLLPFGISGMAAKAAAAALEASEYLQLSVKRNDDDRQEFLNQVNARFLHAVDSRANFFALNPMRPIDQVIEHFANNKIIVGPRIPQMPAFVRVSLGTPGDMKEFWRVLDLLPGAGKMVM